MNDFEVYKGEYPRNIVSIVLMKKRLFRLIARSRRFILGTYRINFQLQRALRLVFGE